MGASMKVLSLLLRNRYALYAALGIYPGLNESPELIAQEFIPSRLDLRSLSASMKVLSLLLRNQPMPRAITRIPEASMKVLSLLLRNCRAGAWVGGWMPGLNESPELIAQESCVKGGDVAIVAPQ